MADPLAGQREAINRGEVERLLWPDEGKGCLVDVGDIFKLRTCHIEIVRRRRVQSGRNWFWRAEFTRRYPEGRVHLLDRKGSYTDDPEQALRAQDDPDAATIFTAEPMENPQNLSAPPEPEAIPPHEVATLPSSVAARARFEALRQHDEQQRRVCQLSDKLRSLQRRAERDGLDLGPEIDGVALAIADVERRVVAKAA